MAKLTDDKVSLFVNFYTFELLTSLTVSRSGMVNHLLCVVG